MVGKTPNLNFFCAILCGLLIGNAKATKPDIWQEIAASLNTDSYVHSQSARKEMRWYLSHPKSLFKITNNAKPYIYYVINELKKRNMPLEIALLPMIESNYNPQTVSSASASGLWQLMPDTARELGVPVNAWYDGRRDIVSSTHAALDYLAYLKDHYRSWPLAFAAYNSGMGTVNKAIHYNKTHHLATNYQALPLPAETKRYVPKLIAIATLLSRPENYHLPIKSVKNQPYFTPVTVDYPIEIRQIAKLSETSIKVIRQLNPGFRQNRVFPSHRYKILLPEQQKRTFQINLASYTKRHPNNDNLYRVQSGDSLSKIAKNYHVSIARLKNYNHLDTSLIIIGQPLYIPV